MVSQQEATRLVVLMAAGHQLISTTAWNSQCSHVWACKTHEMNEVGYGLE